MIWCWPLCKQWGMRQHYLALIRICTVFAFITLSRNKASLHYGKPLDLSIRHALIQIGKSKLLVLFVSYQILIGFPVKMSAILSKAVLRNSSKTSS